MPKVLAKEAGCPTPAFVEWVSIIIPSKFIFPVQNPTPASSGGWGTKAFDIFIALACNLI